MKGAHSTRPPAVEHDAPRAASSHSRFARLVGDDRSFSLQHRMANGLLLILAAITLVTSAINMALGLLPRSGLMTGIAGILHVGLYLWARRGPSHQAPTLLSLSILTLVLYPGLWLTNYGLQGGTQLGGVALALATVSVIDGWRRNAMLALLGVVTAILFMVEYASPELMGTYPSRLAQYLDVSLATLAMTAALVLLYRAMQTNYDRERDKTRAYAEIVERSNAELEAALATNRELALTDALTQLPNRRSLETFLSAKVREVERYHRPLAVVLLDVDHFKSVNDTYGHAVGDTILVGLAEVMRERLRSSDLCARWGGEEFVLMCPETGLDGAVTVAERLRRAVEERELATGVRVTVSLGVAVHRPGDDVTALFHRADEALYAAKRAGRNRVIPADQHAPAPAELSA